MAQTTRRSWTKPGTIRAAIQERDPRATFARHEAHATQSQPFRFRRRRRCSWDEPPTPVSPRSCRGDSVLDAPGAEPLCFGFPPIGQEQRSNYHQRCNQQSPPGQRPPAPSTRVQARRLPSIRARASCMTWLCGVAGRGSAKAS